MRHTLTVAVASLCVASLCVASAALATPRSYRFPDETATLTARPGPGFEAAQNNCAACHSVDYITHQPPRKGRAFWEGEVHKMINVFGAEIEDDDAKDIIEYLATTY